MADDDAPPARVTGAEKMMYVLESLHRAGESDSRRLAVPTGEMVLYSGARPYAWYFTASTSGSLMKRHSHRLKPENVYGAFEKHGKQQGLLREGVSTPVALSHSRGAGGTVVTRLLDLQEVSDTHASSAAATATTTTTTAATAATTTFAAVPGRAPAIRRPQER